MPITRTKRSRILAGVSIGLSIGVVVTIWASAAQGPSPAGRDNRPPMTTAEFAALFQKVSNWGRWGKDDELGSVNLITPAKRIQAAGLVKSGISISLSHNPMKEIAADNETILEHTMNPGLATDSFKFMPHGIGHSHLDALCHIGYEGKTYNGYDRAAINTENGCTKLGLEAMKAGVVTRGILIDVPRMKGLPYLEPQTAVLVEDLEAWEKKAGVKIGSGDAILLRTGRWARRDKLGPWSLRQGSAGFHASVASWIKDRGVAVVGSDGVQDIMPTPIEGINLPVHTLLITALGIPLLDNQDLEQLAEVAAKLKRWEFMLSFAPVPVAGSTGFLVNATATF
jgi:kynurenine formamidase